MSKINGFIASQFVRFTGYTYSNMARMFMRLFVGIMFLQFGIRHWVNYSSMAPGFPAVLGMSSPATLTVMILVEVVCSLFIIIGLLTRLSCIPPIFTMILAEYHILHDMIPDASVYGLDSVDPGYLPIMFIGIYIFLLLAGPGRISLDYFISLRIIESQGKNEEEELQEV